MADRPTESVWGYPRPPIVVSDDREIVIEHGGVVIVRTTEAVRVLETSHPPTFYVPADAVKGAVLVPSRVRTHCEFKGVASYWDLTVEATRSLNAAWGYEDPMPGFEELRGMVAFYPGRVDRCSVADESVRAQEGGFYGGWITSEIDGPFKGAPGTSAW
ncbi:MAG TPA: DUF427 domain-containing protein [Acidimicrobiia bacterium]|nr:DUF427 domain-containing protein [Acidimicrobiia bacterium]